MDGNGRTILASERLQGPDSPPVESERWWLEMARRKSRPPADPADRSALGERSGSVECSVLVPDPGRMLGVH